MSALQAPVGVPEPRLARTTLRAVSTSRQPIARLPFVLIVALLLGSGMIGVLLLSTTIQAQSSELSDLQSQEADLRYQEAALAAQVQDLRSSSRLAQSAWELGMRPNPNPAFIQMPDGQVTGDPTPVEGDELTGMDPVVVPETPVVSVLPAVDDTAGGDAAASGTDTTASSPPDEGQG